MNILSDPNFIISLVVGIFVGIASGYLGSIMVLKRMALVGDALSHVALPGMGLAILYAIDPFIGAFAALAIGVLIVWAIKAKTTIPTEAIVGLIFASSLAIGVLITPEPELLEALFGDISAVALIDGLLAIVLSISVLGIMYFVRKKIMLGLISPDLAKSEGINIKLLDLLFLGLVAVVVALGVKVVGTLLMGALVVIPAVAAKNVSQSMSRYGAISATFGAASAILGISLAALTGASPGPLVVLVSAGLFLLTLAMKRG